jgi:hypothetical protein
MELALPIMTLGRLFYISYPSESEELVNQTWNFIHAEISYGSFFG